jgi:predicted PurR-regulated permease PerM
MPPPWIEVAPLLGAAIIIAALYLGRDLLVPLVLAVMLAFVLTPLAARLRRLGLPRAPAVVLTVLLAVGAIVSVAWVVLRQLAALAGDLPAFSRNLAAKLSQLRIAELLAQAQSTLAGLRGILGGPHQVPPSVPVPTTEASPLEVAAAYAGPVVAPLATFGIVVVFALFILLYRENLRDRLIRLAGVRDLHRTNDALDDAARRLSKLFLAQLALNAGFAALVSLGLWLLGLPGAPLWGIVAGLMRFVPFLGIWVAVVPPLVLALAADPGWTLALSVAALFLLTEPLMGQVAEPLILGRSAGLSPLSVIVAAAFWTFMWGPIGLILATPLTVCLVVLGRHVPRLEFLEVMLGDTPPLQPEESFYQRALEGDADALVAQARGALKTDSALRGWHDEVTLPALALAQADWSRDVLDPARLEGIRQQVETLLDELAETPQAESAHLLPTAWTEEGAVLCLAGRGRLDDLAAAVAAQALRHDGFGAVAMPGTVLEGAADPRLDPARVRVCCVSVVGEGASAAATRYFLRRVMRRLPGVPVAVALWHAPAGSAMLAELRQQSGGAALVATSLAEILAFCQTRAAMPETVAEPVA